MKKVIETKNARAPVGPYSQALIVDGTLYCSGQIPIVPETGDILTGDIQEQTKQVMKNAEAVLKEADYSWSDVIKTTIFLTDLGDFGKVNESMLDIFQINSQQDLVFKYQLFQKVLMWKLKF